MVNKMHKIFLITLLVVFSSNFQVWAQDNIKLSKPDLSRGKLLMQALSHRKTQRAFSEKELSLDTLSNLLWAAFGINRPDTGLRTAPSAHNWQEIDIYVAKKDGLFIYKPKKHSLEVVTPKDIRQFTGKQEFTQVAPVNLIYVADYSRMKASDKERDFYSAIDTGFISQNVCLFCASEGLSTVTVGWVEKPALKKLMKLKETQHIIITQPVGYPAE